MSAGSGPRVVAIGGGHGLAATLRAVRGYAGDIAAIVSVADDGGSSGRLRDAFAIPPPGDLRKCLVALAEPGSVWARAFEHRFDAGELTGHPLGNLIIAGLAGCTGDFLSALEEAGRVMGAVGRVLPATAAPVVLAAEAEDGPVEGQVKVAGTGGITRVSIRPPEAEPPEAAVAALADADQVVIGPGSLFTSVLAVVAVPALCRALAVTPARKVYVCNLRPQVPETRGYDVGEHVRALARHGLDVDVVVWDPKEMAPGDLPVPAVEADLTRRHGYGHDPTKLAEALSHLVG